MVSSINKIGKESVGLIEILYIFEWEIEYWGSILSTCVCDPGGSLSDAIMKKEVQGELFSESELKDLLLQVSMGLKYIHSSGLVHLDIKPSMSPGTFFQFAFACVIQTKPKSAHIPAVSKFPTFQKSL